MTTTTIQPRALRETPAAAYTGHAPGTLRNMRHQGRGPRYIKAGRTVLYAVADLDDWLDGLPSLEPVAVAR